MKTYSNYYTFHQINEQACFVHFISIHTKAVPKKHNFKNNLTINALAKRAQL